MFPATLHHDWLLALHNAVYSMHLNHFLWGKNMQSLLNKYVSWGCCQKGSGQASCQPWEANRNCFQWLLDKVIESEVQEDRCQSELVAWGPVSTSSHPEAWVLRKNIDVFSAKKKGGNLLTQRKGELSPTKANYGHNGRVPDLEVITTVHNEGCHRS